jgi:hypothetical protein
LTSGSPPRFTRRTRFVRTASRNFAALCGHFAVFARQLSRPLRHGLAGRASRATVLRRALVVRKPRWCKTTPVVLRKPRWWCSAAAHAAGVAPPANASALDVSAHFAAKHFCLLLII